MRLTELRSDGCTAIVAVRRRIEGKRRLAKVLGVPERLALVRRMLARVLAVLQTADSVARVVVVSPERDEIPSHIPVLADPGNDQNFAVAHAHQLLRDLGCREFLILPADLPTLSPAEVDQFVALGRRQGFALAVDSTGHGSNGIYLRGSTDFEFHFGSDSASAHRRAARCRGWSVPATRIAGFMYDVDLPRDLARLDVHGIRKAVTG